MQRMEQDRYKPIQHILVTKCPKVSGMEEVLFVILRGVLTEIHQGLVYKVVPGYTLAYMAIRHFIRVASRPWLYINLFSNPKGL